MLWQQQAACAGAALGLLTPPLVAAPEEQQGTTTEMNTSSTRKRKAGVRDRTQPAQGLLGHSGRGGRSRRGPHEQSTHELQC
ncbi:hypothetical protein HaLaN_15980 [Haematococcus lacustris]|uniref:Secreted protein n=1 Tax=Haematococcus lacustris TaxID=44745 RepID=A0A699ZJ76_HAELA|nr:hypothetical protein HaLaN_15980 [Haematococcus lacustris]